MVWVTVDIDKLSRVSSAPAGDQPTQAGENSPGYHHFHRDDERSSHAGRTRGVRPVRECRCHYVGRPAGPAVRQRACGLRAAVDVGVNYPDRPLRRGMSSVDLQSPLGRLTQML